LDVDCRPLSPALSFVCNLCGAANEACALDRIDRDLPSCSTCGSTVRLRSIIHLVSSALFGESLALPDFPQRKTVVGIGLSDSPLYAGGLARKLAYTNTYLDQEPRLDLAKPPPALLATCDFVISADVFEHVLPPATRAFRAAYNLLKPGGALILTVPYVAAGETVEHFPHLRDFRLVEMEGAYVMVELDAAGGYRLHTDLVFHEGPGRTLEMRVFSQAGVLRELREAGFGEIEVFSEPYPRWGIRNKCPWSLPILARRPRR